MNLKREQCTCKPGRYWLALIFLTATATLYGCASSESSADRTQAAPSIPALHDVPAPSPDPRVDLQAGLFTAEEAIWNLRKLSSTPPPDVFIGSMNSDLAFFDHYAIQGNFNGFMIWDIANPAEPELVIDYLCPASQSDVSVYNNLLFVSGEGLEGRLDCGTQGVFEASSPDRLRGIRIFDISDIQNPEYIANVQTCRGSHTHSVLVDPDDDENIYIYVSGSAPVRPETELEGCIDALPEEDPESALFRIEIIQVPLANPQEAAIVNRPRIFEGLEAPERHGMTAADREELDQAIAEGAFVVEFLGEAMVLPEEFVVPMLSMMVQMRGGSGEPTAADSAALRESLPEMLGIDDALMERGPNQCHDITLYPELGIAGGACEGYGLLLDISDPVNPKRIDAVADSNFAYWHSATFNNDGTTVIFTDEWGGGLQAKCRETDPKEWGANALFSIRDGKMHFESYFKLEAPQTETENCVAHNGSIIPVPGRDIMVQSWYQGGILLFDFTDPANPVEIAFHDRGPVHADRMESAGSWSVYWYNGYIVNSEIARGLDIFELIPSDFITANEIEAAKTVRQSVFNPQGQPKLEWPASFYLARAYADQLERNREVDMPFLHAVRTGLAQAERANGSQRTTMLRQLAVEVENHSGGTRNPDKMKRLAQALQELAAAS
ncbi:MAG: LVIVD repeat-containing protein [Balneolaceae bacterium]